MTVFEGKLVSENIKVGIVASRFNEFITSKLIGGAMDGLLRHNVREQDVDIAWGTRRFRGAACRAEDGAIGPL